MNDLMSRLSALGSERTPTDEVTVAADVRRGRRALRRHRAVRGVTGGALALALAGTGTTIALNGHNASVPSATGHSTTGQGLQLVGYTGEQPAGFTVATVPAGWDVQGVDAGSLDIARPDDVSSIDTFTGKIVVMLQSQDARFRPVGTPVSVNGHPGYIHDPGDGGETLEYRDDQGHDVLVQWWKNLGLTQDQIVQIAEGVTVTADAEAPVG